MPTIVKKRDIYYAQYFDSAKTPTRKRVSLGTKRRRDAERELARLDSEGFDPWSGAKRGTMRGTEKLVTVSSLGKAVDAYMASCSHLAPGTIRTYQSIFDLFAEHLGASFPVASITGEHVLAFLDSTKAQAVTRKKYVNHLGYLFRYLAKRGAMERDVSKDVKLPRLPEQAFKAMSEGEVETMVAYVHDRYERTKDDGRAGDYRWLAGLIRFDVHVGLRLNEVVHAKWDWVDLERGMLTVRNSDTFQTKNGKERTIPLSGQAMDVLRSLERRGLYIFMPDGKQLSREGLSKTFTEISREAGITSGITFHSMRHAFGTWLAEAGVPITVIAQLMDHHSVTVTERYARCRPATAMHWVGICFGRQ